MSPAEIIEHATKDGVLLALSRSGSMSVKGVQSPVDRWLPAIRQSKAAIVLLLRPGTDGWSAEDWQGRPQTGAETLAAVEDAQMSTFDESLDFRGFLSGPPSKMLIPPSLSALDDDEHLHSPTSPASVSGETRELRAAFGRPGGVPRAWMEGLSRFDPDWPPGDVPVERWRTLIVDIGRFLDGRWGEKAAALGWGPIDLFGCDGDRPYARRIDQAGLLWLLNGNRLVALSENTATIEMHTGAQQTYHRRPRELGRVLAWELIPRRRHQPPTAK